MSGSPPADQPAWRWTPGETVPRLSGAIIYGTPTLDTAHRLTLLIYARHLAPRRLIDSYALVSLRVEEGAARRGATAAEVRWHLQNLESAGYLVRGELGNDDVYDLAPTLAQLPLMEAYASRAIPAPFERPPAADPRSPHIMLPKPPPHPKP
jgi:hypothetical protein